MCSPFLLFITMTTLILYKLLAVVALASKALVVTSRPVSVSYL